MPHNAEDVMGELDWEEWPDFELFEEDEGDDVSNSGPATASPLP